MKKNKEDKATIILMIIATLVAILLFFGEMFVRAENDYLRKRVEFEPIKEGLCIYVEHDPWQGYIYCLVYDYEVEQVFEVEL